MINKNFYKEVVKESDFTPSHLELFKHVCFDVLIFSTITYSIQSGQYGLYILAQILWPVLFFRCFSLMHDAVHSSVSSNQKINNLVGYIAGAFCFLPFFPWKKAHLQHHYWAGNIEKDPVMKIVKDYDPQQIYKNKFLGFAWKTWIPLLAILQHVVFWGLGFKFLSEAKSRNAIMSWVFSYSVPALIYYQLYRNGLFSLASVGPGLLIYLGMVEIINFPHHLELPQNKGETKIPVWEQYLISRSCLYPKWLARWVLNNFNFHTEHHMFPQAPWYALDVIHEKIKTALGERYNYSLKNAWILKNRKNSIGNVLIYKPEIIPEVSSEDAA